MAIDKDALLHAIEDMLDSSEIPMTEYDCRFEKMNGDCRLNICRTDKERIPHMYLFSEIFNSYTEDWYVKLCEGHIHLIVE